MMPRILLLRHHHQLDALDSQLADRRHVPSTESFFLENRHRDTQPCGDLRSRVV